MSVALVAQLEEVSKFNDEKGSSEKWYAPWAWSKFSKASFSGDIRLSSSSFCLNADQNDSVFFFDPLILEISHSSTISLEMTVLRGPLNIRIGKEGGIPAILDAENHFWVHRRPRKRPKVGYHFSIKWGMDRNVFSIMRADTCNKECKWIKVKRKESYASCTLSGFRLVTSMATAPPSEWP